MYYEPMEILELKTTIFKMEMESSLEGLKRRCELEEEINQKARRKKVCLFLDICSCLYSHRLKLGFFISCPGKS